MNSLRSSLRFALLFFVFLSTTTVHAEGIRSITIIPPTDGTGLNISRDLQQHIGEYLYNSRQYVVQYSAHSLSGFTARDLSQTFERLDSQLILFPYVEKGRFSLFLFDSYRPQEFITASVPFAEVSEKNPLSKQIVYAYFPKVYAALINSFSRGQYQVLPGGKTEGPQTPVDDKELTRKQFRALSSLYESNTYGAANVGIVRMANAGVAGSTVNLSLYIGHRFSESMAIEGGADFFSYFFPNARLRYKLPFFANRYPMIDLTIGAGMNLGEIATQKGFPSGTLSSGPLFGPGLSVRVPLGGAQLVCDLRFYMGSGSLFFGTYGLAYPL